MRRPPRQRANPGYAQRVGTDDRRHRGVRMFAPMTVGEFLLYAGGALTILWGTAHLYPTRKVVRGFEPISTDNRRILTMEWIAEAILLIFTGALMVVMTARFGADRAATQTAAALSSAALLILAGVSASTGGRAKFIMYRLCAPILVVSAALILAGAMT